MLPAETSTPSTAIAMGMLFPAMVTTVSKTMITGMASMRSAKRAEIQSPHRDPKPAHKPSGTPTRIDTATTSRLSNSASLAP